MIVKDNPNSFGNINILFCGDFHQLPPIMAKALYMRSKVELNPNYSVQLNQHEINYSFGRVLWLKLTKVIFLDKQMRQNKDVLFHNILKRLRHNSLE